MALDGSRSERQSLGISRKSYGKSYGSLQKSKQEIYIKHIVSETDTLQGLALKYGVSIEQIKRANKLFTTDSIFLRKVLNIPVGEQPLPAHVLETATASLTNGNGNNTSDTAPIIPKTKEESESETEAEAPAETTKAVTEEHKKEEEGATEKDEPRDETMDFFNRIDRQVRNMKTEVKRIEENSSLKELESKEPPAPNPAAPYDYKTRSTPAYQGDNVIPTATYRSNTSSSTGSPKIFAKAKSLFSRKEGGSKKLSKAGSQGEELLQEDQDGFYQL
ncbi:lysM and putative peptidoglycan-binding domain-containing protein 2-like [Ptychodera flava]|uniref:lysM and putative peptidoglycan-binding domain-containing protein 2-like n=1 Tax=Ptychodera flava TaxID=63121 RepID=UPI00396A25D1